MLDNKSELKSVIKEVVLNIVEKPEWVNSRDAWQKKLIEKSKKNQKKIFDLKTRICELEELSPSDRVEAFNKNLKKQELLIKETSISIKEKVQYIHKVRNKYNTHGDEQRVEVQQEVIQKLFSGIREDVKIRSNKRLNLKENKELSSNGWLSQEINSLSKKASLIDKKNKEDKEDCLKNIGKYNKTSSVRPYDNLVKFNLNK
ncbi:MAG: hypothetical protein GY793_07410 [Proteobacteria bacterium]|nr:hypothetical protein [Pseudomonadota bacterium]